MPCCGVGSKRLSPFLGPSGEKGTSRDPLALCLPCIPCPFWPGDDRYMAPGEPFTPGDAEFWSMDCHAGLAGAPLGSAPPKKGRAGVRNRSDNESDLSSCSCSCSWSAPACRPIELSMSGRPEMFSPPGERGDLAPAEPEAEEPVLRGTSSA